MPIMLRVIKGPMKGKSFALKKSTMFLGRSSKNDIQIRDTTISRKQIKLFLLGSKLFVEDLKSTNGTKLNGIPIVPGEGVEVGESDMLTMGDTVVQITGVEQGKVFPGSWPITTAAKAEKQEEQAETKERRSLARNMQLVVELGELLKEGLSLHNLCEKVLDFLLVSLPRIDRATLALFNPDDSAITTIVSRTRSGQKEVLSPYSREILEKTLKTGKSIRMSNTQYEPPANLSDSIGILKIKSLMCVPMISNKQVRGAIYVDSLKRPYAFRKEDLMLLNALSGPVAIAAENALLTGQAP